MRVLYVEDATLLANAVKHNLERQGITADLANDGEEGLDKALKDIYDCVILDIMLPKLSGTDILKRMREKKCSNARDYAFGAFRSRNQSWAFG